jgi:hypothetical protein
MVNLDATASNRSMWGAEKRNYHPDWVYMDREYDLWLPPTVFGDFTKAPFRDDVFNVVLFDPPYYVRGDTPSANKWFYWNPKGDKLRPNGTKRPHYGRYLTRKQLINNLHMGAKEFYRISKRLCLQWGDSQVSLWNILPLFKPWVERYKRGRRSRGEKARSTTWWLMFDRF